MRTHTDPERALHWRLDPEHEAFRGVAAQSALRLIAVLAAIVLVFGLLVLNPALAEGSGEEQATAFAGQLEILLPEAAAPG